MGQIFKQFFLSYWFLVALLFSIIFFGVKNSKILRGSGPPKVKLDEKTGTMIPDDAWRTRLAWILGLSAVFGVPILTRTGAATATALGYLLLLTGSAVAIDQIFAKFREKGIPKINKHWVKFREKFVNKGRKS